MKNKEHIAVGKNILESLTVGMYADNKIIYREYIQNAADAIFEAANNGSLKNINEGRIDITINRDKNKISIKDNGVGVASEHVLHALGDIGKSKKNYKKDMGFRGIGRLGGLGYCDVLKFSTSAAGEQKATTVTWNAKELRHLLLPDQQNELSVAEVIDEVTDITEYATSKEEHFFEIIMEGVTSSNSALLDIEYIKKYISQVAPIKYNFQQNANLKIINETFASKYDYKPEVFNVYVNKEPIYKPYGVDVEIGNEKKDKIAEIKFFEGVGADDKYIFAGWYGVTDLSGMIQDERINGLRVRKKNILIGDNRTSDDFFGNNATYKSRNRWFVGEIFVFDPDIIPNARRDGFEGNDAFLKLFEKISKTTNHLAKQPHLASSLRSGDKKLKQAQSEIEAIKNEIKAGITEERKKELVNKLSEKKKVVEKVKVVAGANHGSKMIVPEKRKVKIESVKEGILEEIGSLVPEVQNALSITVASIPRGFGREARDIMEAIFKTIDIVLPEGQACELKNRVILEIKKYALKKKLSN